MRLHEAFLPPHLPRAITVPATSLWFNLEVSAARYPDKPALIFLGQLVEGGHSLLGSGAELAHLIAQAYDLFGTAALGLDHQLGFQFIACHVSIA